MLRRCQHLTCQRHLWNRLLSSVTAADSSRRGSRHSKDRRPARSSRAVSMESQIRDRNPLEIAPRRRLAAVRSPLGPNRTAWVDHFSRIPRATGPYLGAMFGSRRTSLMSIQKCGSAVAELVGEGAFGFLSPCLDGFHGVQHNVLMPHNPGVGEVVAFEVHSHGFMFDRRRRFCLRRRAWMTLSSSIRERSLNSLTNAAGSGLPASSLRGDALRLDGTPAPSRRMAPALSRRPGLLTPL